jgi:hypothetical protein
MDNSIAMMEAAETAKSVPGVDSSLLELSSVQLAFVGGGCGETIAI